MRNRIWIGLGVVCALFAVMQMTGTQAEGPERTYLVLGATNALPVDFESAVTECGGVVVGTIPQIGVAVVKSTTPDFAGQAEGIPGIEGVGANTRDAQVGGLGTDASLYGVGESISYKEEAKAYAVNPPNAAEDDPLFDAQWGLDAVDAPEAWDTGERGAKARVFVLDSGITLEHADLKPNINVSLCKSFVPGESVDAIATQPLRPLPFFNHGTHVAGIIGAADNEFGVIGVAPEVEIVAVKVLSQISGFGFTDWIADGIVYAADNGADVINMSLGGTLNRRGYLETMGTPDTSDDYWVTAKEVAADLNVFSRALDYAHKKGVTIVVAAGNDYADANKDKDAVIAPAELPHTISVAATAPRYWALDLTTNLDLPAVYTNYGQSLVDFSAPGGSWALPPNFTLVSVGRVGPRPVIAFDYVLSTSPGAWFWAAGTSMAAPHVAGVAALIISKNGGSMHPDQVYAALRKASDDLGSIGRDDYHGHGRINAYKAVK